MITTTRSLMNSFGFLLLASWLVGFSSADDWPSFFGPERDGHSAEAGLDFSAPKVLWRAPVGIGFSSCSVVDGKMYTMGSDKKTDTVWCLDAATGREIWTHRYKAALVDRLHEGGPATTPTVDGEWVYTCGKEGQVFCLNRTTGEPKWRVDLQKRFGSRMPEWGFSGSPWIEGDRLYIDAGPLVALNKNSGETIWKTRTFPAGYGSPFAFAHEGTRFVSVLNNDGLLVVKAADGEEVVFWEWETSYETNGTTPYYRNGHIFLSTAYNRGCTLLKFDGKALTKLYENKEMRNHMANSVYHDGHLYGVDRKAHNRRLVTLACMEAGTGEIAWRAKDLGCGSLIMADGHLIVLSDRGELVIGKASPEGFAPVSRTPVLDGTCWTSPALADGRLYVRDAKGNLACVSVQGK